METLDLLEWKREDLNTMHFSGNWPLLFLESWNGDLEASKLKTVKGYKLRHLNVLQKMEVNLLNWMSFLV